MTKHNGFIPMLFCIGVLVGCESERRPAYLREPGEEGGTEERFENLVEYVAEPIIRLEGVEPTGIAVDAEGRIHLADRRGVSVFDRDGNPLRQWRTDSAAHGIALDSEANVYVGLRDRVLKYDADGNLLTSWGKSGKERGEFRFITSLAVSGYDVYVADAANRAVLRFDITGDFIDEIGKSDEPGDTGIVAPSMYLGIAARNNGELMVGNPGQRMVERYSRDGRLIAKWGRSSVDPTGFVGCSNPVHVAMTDDDCVVTVEKGIPRVKVHDINGKLLSVMDVKTVRPVTPGDLSDALGPECFGAVAVDRAGRILVLHPDKGWIWVFRKKADEAEEPGDE